MTPDQQLKILESYTTVIDIGKSNHANNKWFAVITEATVFCQGYGNDREEAIHNLYQDFRHRLRVECGISQFG